nr:helix-turn-helix transcriptional regulator [Dyadobacter sp. CY312]
MNGKNISPSIFADEIGIQRSSMSHILAGRNKPSLDIVQKIVKRFPELGVNWILDEQELPMVSEAVTSYQSVPEPALASEKKVNNAAPQSTTKNETPEPVVQESVVGREQQPTTEKTVTKVMMFYSDGTFEEFKSAIR